MVWIEGGGFIMGSALHIPRRALHEVTVAAIDAYDPDATWTEMAE